MNFSITAKREDAQDAFGKHIHADSIEEALLRANAIADETWPTGIWRVTSVVEEPIGSSFLELVGPADAVFELRRKEG